MNAVARFFELLTRDGVSACIVRLALLAALPAASVSNSLGGIVFWLLVLACIAHLIARRGMAPKLSRSAFMLVLAASLLPLALNIASVLWFALPAREIAWTPLLAFPIIVGALLRVPHALPFWVAGAVLASFTLLAITGYAVVWLHHDRPSLTMNALLYGKTALVAMIVCGWGLSLYERRPVRLLLVLAILAGLSALVLTGYRGGFLVLPIVIVAALPFGSRRKSGVRISLRQASLAAVAAVAAVAIAGSNVALLDRMHKAASELESYQQGRIQNSSVGSRLSMWVAAGTMYRTHPLFGVGTHRFHAQSEALQQQGLYPRDAKLYRHAHNSYLNTAAEYGSVGIVVMLIALIALFRLCWSAAPPVRALALLTLAGWMLMALTNDLFAHQTLIRTLVLSMAVAVAAGLAAAPEVPAGAAVA